MYGSRRNEGIKAILDIEFLEKLKKATHEELLVMLKNHSHKNAPEWKKIAIQRALKRL